MSENKKKKENKEPPSPSFMTASMQEAGTPLRKQTLKDLIKQKRRLSVIIEDKDKEPDQEDMLFYLQTCF